MASLVAQRLKLLPPMLETWVQSLGREDPLEEEMATHSSTLAWRIPWREEPGRLHTIHGVAKSRTRLSDFTFSFHFQTINFNKLLGSCGIRTHAPEGTRALIQCLKLLGHTTCSKQQNNLYSFSTQAIQYNSNPSLCPNH